MDTQFILIEIDAVYWLSIKKQRFIHFLRQHVGKDCFLTKRSKTFLYYSCKTQNLCEKENLLENN